MYKITFLPDAEDTFRKLDKPVQKRIAQKIDWLAENADKVIHHPLKSWAIRGHFPYFLFDLVDKYGKYPHIHKCFSTAKRHVLVVNFSYLEIVLDGRIPNQSNCGRN